MRSMNRRRFIQTGLAGFAGLLGGCGGQEPGPTPTTVTVKPPLIPGFRGRIIQRGDDYYEKWRRSMVWNLRKPERYPEMILRPAGAADVQTALRFAAQRGLRVSVRSGGHNVWGAALREGGILLDLSEFKDLRVSAARGYADAGPALWARDLMEGLGQHGYGFPVAHCASVPLGGYVLGGGLGLNGDQWDNMACYGILGGEFVTGTGEIIEVDEKTEDLLWAMRGGGALPGVVTRIRIKTYHRPAQVFSATYVYPMTELDSALSLLQAVVDSHPPNTEFLALMTHNPQAPPDAPPIQRKAIVIRAQVYADEQAGANPALDLMVAHPAAARSVFSLPALAETYESLFVDSMDWRRGFGFGRMAVENVWTESLLEAVRAIAPAFLEAPSWKSHVVVQPKNAGLRPGEGALSVMSNVFVGVYTVWDDAGADRANLDWLTRMQTTLDPLSRGHYVNEIDAAASEERLKRSFSEPSWARLREIRSRFDPDGVMHDFPGLS